MSSVFPIISIGLPVFNGENYLREAMESLLEQTFGDFEIIISDNASTDGTREICEEFVKKDFRVNYHRSETNRGAAWNYNNTVNLSRGEYFKWAAHDDCLEPEFLETCLGILQTNSDASLAFTKAVVLDDRSHLVSDYPDSDSRFASSDPVVRYREIVYGNHQFINVFGLIPMKVLKKTRLIGGYASSDVVLMGQLSLAGKIIESEKRLFKWRSHEEQSMKKVFKGNDNRAYTYWFNPSRKGKMNFPHWRLLYEYIRSFMVSTLSFKQKLRGIKLILQSRTRISGRRQYLLDIVDALKSFRFRF